MTVYIGQGFVISPVNHPAWRFALAGGGRYAVHCAWPRYGSRAT